MLVSQRQCAQLAAWGSAWLQGSVAFDAVLDAVATNRRQLAGPGYVGHEAHPVGASLTSWKQAGSEVLLLALPVPGDVRGLAGPPEFRSAALAAGEAVFGLMFGVTVTLGPETPSSAGRPLIWQRGDIDSQPSAPVSLSDAEYELAEAIRETASLFARRDAPSWLADVAPALSDARRAGERLHLPASHPPRAVRLLAQAERMAAVLRVIDADDTGEVTAAGMAERSAALGPLRLAVRHALLAGYNAPAEVAAS
ncbi:MAG: hypothetical protein JWN95_2800 [Frankiales bacterium]|nr:hypothetical protein [Frankiales bacterium]